MGSDPLLTVVEAKNVWVLASIAVMKGSDPIKSTSPRSPKESINSNHVQYMNRQCYQDRVFARKSQSAERLSYVGDVAPRLAFRFRAR